jgi:hypothetical protein
MLAGEDAEASKETDELPSPVSAIIAELHGTGIGSTTNELIQLNLLLMTTSAFSRAT